MSTAAEVDIVVPNNAYLQEAFRFGDDDDTSWSFTGKTFIMEVKVNHDATTALLELTTANSRIVVDDATLRILHFFVTDDAIRAAVPNGQYVYDLIMIDGSNNARTRLMFGKITFEQGVTLTD